jgi:hypothetical protein
MATATETFDSCFRILGDARGPRMRAPFARAFDAYRRCDSAVEIDRQAYLSAFTFGRQFDELLRTTGSVAGYDGPTGGPHVWWDFDADELAAAKDGAQWIVYSLVEKFGVPADAVLVLFSGAKGFHVGLPSWLTGSTPGDLFHETTKRFCVGLAEYASATTTLDAGIYDRVRPFRAPNSRHGKTGRFKRHLPTDRFEELEVPEILELAREPQPFDVMPAGPVNDRLAELWADAARQAAAAVDERAAKRAAIASGEEPPRLNRAVREFIGGHDLPAKGSRHRMLYSHARNLADCGAPLHLIHELLVEPARDTGLPPKEVTRQIDSGFDDSILAGRDVDPGIGNDGPEVAT